MGNLERKLSDIYNLIGNTPLVEILYRYRGKEGRVYAKLEYYNLSGSIKDRMAYSIISGGLLSGNLKEGMSIVETTSGNAGISMCTIAAYLGIPVDIFMPDWLSKERISLMKSFGANIHLVSKADGGFAMCFKQCEDMENSEYCFLTKQFENNNNVMAHENTTSIEIIRQSEALGIEPNVFVAGVGTGGTIMGVRNGLGKVFSSCKFHPLEPSNSPTLSTGHKVGSHRIQGISDEFIPKIVNLSSLDDVIQVHDGDAIIASQKLAKELGLGVGISSGANFLGAVLLASRYGEGSNVFTVFADDNKKYLTTDLAGEEKVLEGFVSSEIELIGYKSHR